jgi:hypothetical protein
VTTRFWTYHWQNKLWRNDVNPEYEPVGCSLGNIFTKRGIAPGDVVYIVSLAEGQLLLGGRMTVERIVGYEEAVAHFDNENLYEAKECLIGKSGTPLNLHRRLSPSITKQLRFASKSGTKEPYFKSHTKLDNQATRGVRELTRASAALLDGIIAATDNLPRTGQVVTVTDELLRGLTNRIEF